MRMRRGSFWAVVALCGAAGALAAYLLTRHATLQPGSPSSREYPASADRPPALSGLPAGSTPVGEAPGPEDGGRLLVHVSDRRGTPIEEAVVYLLPAGLDGSDDLPAGHRRLTDKSGTAGFATTGRFTLGVKKQGYLAATRQLVIGKDGTERLTVELDSGAWLTGRIRDAMTGDPVRNARILYSVPGFASEGRWEFPAVAERVRLWDLAFAEPNLGTFAITGLPPNEYQVEVKAAGYATATLSPVRVPGGALDVEMWPSCTIEVVVDPWDGSEETVVEVTATRMADPRVTDGIVAKGTRGTLVVRDHLVPGEYEILVKAEGLGFARSLATLDAAGQAVRVRVRLAPCRHLHVVASAARVPDGLLRVVDQHAVTRLYPLGPIDPRVPLVPGRYRIDFLSPTALSEVVEVEVAADEDAWVSLGLVDPATVKVKDGVVGSYVCLGPEGHRGEILQYRGDALVHVGDEVSVRPGDLLVLRPMTEMILSSLSSKERAYDVSVGVAYDLLPSGLVPRSSGEEVRGESGDPGSD